MQDDRIMIAIDNLQKLVARALTGLALVHVPILFILATILGASPIVIGGVALFFAGVSILLTVLKRPPQMVAFSLTVALVSQTALLVSIFAGHPWQVEMHFYFFAILAMFAGFCDVWILIAAASMIAMHHLLFNGLIPNAIYPGGGNMLRLGVHAAIVVIETSMLILIARVIRAAFKEASTAKATASHLADVGTTLKEELSATTERANYFEISLTAFRGEIAQSLGKLGVASKTLDEAADGFSTAILQTTSRAKAVAVTAADANQRVGNVASAGRAYVGTMSAISEHTLVSAGMGKAAVFEAEATAATIDELTRMSNRIDTATKLIAGIANQTNLLALNATIEAARAGEHGRGFSVVAAEVKNLASETTKALATISEMVNGIKSSTHRSADAMSSILAAIRGLNGATATIADAVEERVSGAADMSSDVDAAAADVQKVATAIKAIESVTGESAKGAGSVRLAASEIAEQTESIRRHVESFVADLTALHRAVVHSESPLDLRPAVGLRLINSPH